MDSDGNIYPHEKNKQISFHKNDVSYLRWRSSQIGARALSELPDWSLLPDVFCTCAEATSRQATYVCVNLISDWKGFKMTDFFHCCCWNSVMFSQTLAASANRGTGSVYVRIMVERFVSVDVWTIRTASPAACRFKDTVCVWKVAFRRDFHVTQVDVHEGEDKLKLARCCETTPEAWLACRCSILPRIKLIQGQRRWVSHAPTSAFY